MTRSLGLLIAAVPLLSGCFAPEKPTIFSPDPSLKIPAMSSANAGDPKVIRQLVKDLDSDDAAIRFYAIKRLEEITGNSFGYRYYEDEIARAPALKQWKQWLAEKDGTAGRATTEKSAQNAPQNSPS